MKKAISLFWGTFIAATVAAPSYSSPTAIEAQPLVALIAEMSPVPLDETLWASYATCLTQKTDQLSSVTTSTLERYIVTFDQPDGTIRGDLALEINENIIRPCLVNNPLYQSESQHAVEKTTLLTANNKLQTI